MPVVSHEALTVSTTPIGITSNLLVNDDGTPRWIRKATIGIENANIRMTRVTGLVPDNTTNVGLIIPANTVLEIDDYKDLVALRMIRVGASDSKVYIELETE